MVLYGQGATGLEDLMIGFNYNLTFSKSQVKKLGFHEKSLCKSTFLGRLLGNHLSGHLTSLNGRWQKRREQGFT